MTINETQDVIIDEFSIFNEWLEKYSYLIEIGNGLEEFNEKDKIEKYQIKGCQSTVWLTAKKEGDKIIFSADSNSVFTKGIIALLIRILSNHTPEEILNADLYFIDKIDLKNHLTLGRGNGLIEMIKQMREYALAFSTKNE